MKTVYILFNNDLPVLGFTSAKEAEAIAKVRQAANEKHPIAGMPSSYWHIHEVEVISQ